MKAILAVLTAFLSAVTLVGQGTLVFNNNVPGIVVTHVYWDGAVPARFLVGNGPDDTPRDTRNYSSMTPFSFGYAQLWGEVGANQPDFLFRPLSAITTFKQGAEAGFVNPFVATLTNVPKDAPVATLQLRVWVNYGPQTTWRQAETFGDARAVSPAFNVFAIGGDSNPSPYLIGLQSFSFGNVIPEPGACALIALGLLIWLGRLRRA